MIWRRGVSGAEGGGESFALATDESWLSVAIWAMSLSELSACLPLLPCPFLVGAGEGSGNTSGHVVNQRILVWGRPLVNVV